MPKFVIERDIPGVGSSPPDALVEGARESNAVIRELGPDIHWLTSYITKDKVYCVYVAADEDILREHARCVNVPASRISRVLTTQDPSTGE